MKTIVIGAGYWGINYIQTLAGNCIGAVEVDKDRANYVKKHYGVPVWPEIPQHVRFDAVIVCTPPDTHIPIAKEFATQGYYVLIEKPLGVSVEECMPLVKFRDKIMAGMVYLYHPEVDRLKEVCKQIPINHIYTRRTNQGPIRPWQNALWDLAPHDISIINYILGQTPIGISPFVERDWGVLNLDYVACQSCTYVSWLGGPKTRLVELVPAENKERIIFDDIKSTLEISPLRRMLDDFLTSKWDERCSFDAGIEVVKVLEQCQ